MGIDPTVGFQVNDRGSDTVVCAFGGINAGMGVAPFEFTRMISAIGADTIFLKDDHQRWYHSGVVGLAPDLSELAERLGAMVEGYRRKVFVGNSMGGFAALLMGSELRADRSLAFSPQTALGPLKRLAFGEFRWMKQTLSTYRRIGSGGWCFDLASRDLSGSDVYIGGACRQDVLHARNIADTGARIHQFDDAGHDLVKMLRDSGRLRSILEEAVAG